MLLRCCGKIKHLAPGRELEGVVPRRSVTILGKKMFLVKIHQPLPDNPNTAIVKAPQMVHNFNALLLSA